MEKRTRSLRGIGAIIIVSSIVGVGCNKTQQTAGTTIVNENTNVKCVHTRTLSSEAYKDEMTYSGCVMAQETRNFGFELSGTLKEISVVKGQPISKGDVLAKLNTDMVQLGLDKAVQDSSLVTNSINQIQTGIEAEQMNLTQLQTTYDSNIEQLQSQYDLQKSIYEKNSILYEQGGISQVEFQNIETSFKVLEEQLNNLKLTKEQNVELQKTKIKQLQEQYEAAQINLEQTRIGITQSEKYINDSILTSNMDGYVLEVVAKQGEVVGAGSPVVIIKTKEQVINIGVPVEAYSQFSAGMNVKVEASGKQSIGTVSKISLYPDETTRTYNVEIIPEDQDLLMGSLVTVSIEDTEDKACFVPLSAVFNTNGVNYIYYVSQSEGTEEYIVKKQEVSLGKVSNENILVENLEEGTCIVDENIQAIKENDRVLPKE